MYPDDRQDQDLQNSISPSTKRRAPVACRNCNYRKVRCNVAVSGRPCSKCDADGIQCEVLPRKRRMSRKKAPGHESPPTYVQRLVRNLTERPSNLRSSSPLGPEQPSRLEAQLDDSRNQESAASSTTTNPHPSNSSLQDAGHDESQRDNNLEYDEGENPDALAAALDPVASVTTGTDSMFYSGDKHGALSFLSELLNPRDSHRDTHTFVPRGPARSTKAEDLTWVRSKGALTLPSIEVCDELIIAFFQHVYPFLPVLDAESFLREYAAKGCQSFSPLLLWSMYLAAANFVEPRVLQMAGYKTRKAMKRAMYDRAKCLYDIGYEEDYVTLIQSVLMLGFWYTNAQDRFEAWHWTGVAISLSQTCGFHRSPELLHAQGRLSESHRRLFRRIWWSCLIRDSWLSLAKGRPMRIHPEDCDVPLPNPGDIALELHSVSDRIRDRYIPYQPEIVGDLWNRLVSISNALGNVLRSHYKVNGPRRQASSIDFCRREIEACASDNEEKYSTHPNMRLFACQVRLFYEAALIVLYRPFLLKGPEDFSQGEALWQKQALATAKAAATRTNTVLEELMSEDMVKYMKPMIVTILIPAMQIHLLDCKSRAPLTRRLGSHKLQLCMMVLCELQETYWAANFVLKMFQHAQSKLNGQRKGRRSGDEDTNVGRFNTDGLPLTPLSDRSMPVQDFSDTPYVNELLSADFTFGQTPYSLWDTEMPFNATMSPDLVLGRLPYADDAGGFMDTGGG